MNKDLQEQIVCKLAGWPQEQYRLHLLEEGIKWLHYRCNGHAGLIEFFKYSRIFWKWFVNQRTNTETAYFRSMGVYNPKDLDRLCPETQSELLEDYLKNCDWQAMSINWPPKFLYSGMIKEAKSREASCQKK